MMWIHLVKQFNTYGLIAEEKIVVTKKSNVSLLLYILGPYDKKAEVYIIQVTDIHYQSNQRKYYLEYPEIH